MPTNVIMPQMGESVAEGTVTKWLKKVGDRVERDEPLFEISTDKVDAEIPSPAAGILTEIKFQEGETVEINKVVAVLDGGEGASQSNGGASAAEISPAPASQAAVAPEPPPPPAPTEQPQAQTSPQQTAKTPATAATTPAPAPSTAKSEESKTAPPSSQQTQAAASAATGGNGREQTAEELRRTKSSPLVRNIAKEHGIDISRLEGTGLSGRVTKNYILSFIESGAALTPQQALQATQAQTPSAPTMPQAPA